MRIAKWVALVALVAGCSKPVVSPDASAPTSAPASAPARTNPLAAALNDAATGVADPALQQLLRDHWAFVLVEQPVFATSLGVRVYDDRLPERSEAALRRRSEERRALLERLRAIDASGMNEEDRVTRSLLAGQLESSLATEVCAIERWNVGTQDNPLARFGSLPRTHTILESEHAESLVKRYEGIASAVDDEIALLRGGLRRDLVGNAESVRRTIAMLDAELDKPVARRALVEPLLDRARPAEMEHEAWAAFLEVVSRIVDEQIGPALQRYRAFLHEEVLPRARSEQDVGLAALPIGPDCYRARVRRFTTLPMDPQQVHDRGLAEIERIDAELTELGRRRFGTKDLASTLGRLRTDRGLYFESEQEVQEAAETALRLAKARVPAYFGRLPRTDCVVRRIPEYEAPYTHIAYYHQPNADGSKPGEYFVNVLDPHTRPRYEARVLAIHESIPGHHLQIALAQELEGVPAFRRHEGYTAFVEGWALYTERLADEMGMYRDDLDRIGMVSFDAWRAGRLVVDTGMHALGWSRQQAIDFLTEHTALAPNNIDNEVDRYIAWPGQALAYKIGQLELWALRHEAESALGDDFDLPSFHDVVLSGGAVSLPVLRARVEAWIAAESG